MSTGSHIMDVVLNLVMGQGVLVCDVWAVTLKCKQSMYYAEKKVKHVTCGSVTLLNYIYLVL